jgi:uncharacterized protein (DUF342 family)
MKQNKKRKVLKTKITICMSFEAFDKLEQLSERYGISRSQVIETCILTIYNALKEKEKDNQLTTPEEATAEAR